MTSAGDSGTRLRTPSCVRVVRAWWRQVLSALALCSSSLALAWPDIPVPPGSTLHDVGAPMVVNGMLVKAQGLSSPDSPSRVAAWFRARPGPPMTDNVLGTRRVLGRLVDGFFVTIQLEPFQGGTRGIIGISDLQSAARDRPAYESQLRDILDRLPQGSRMISHMASREGGVRSTQWLYANAGSPASNESHLKEMLKRDGMVLERRLDVTASGAGELGATLYFKGRGREASAAINPQPGGAGTTVYLVLVEQEVNRS